MAPERESTHGKGQSASQRFCHRWVVCKTVTSPVYRELLTSCCGTSGKQEEIHTHIFPDRRPSDLAQNQMLLSSLVQNYYIHLFCQYGLRSSPCPLFFLFSGNSLYTCYINYMLFPNMMQVRISASKSIFRLFFPVITGKINVNILYL